jgi:glycosyltransferase involved in cell wall biosynthesis
VLFLSRGRVQLPLSESLAPKWAALEEVFELRALNAGSGHDARFVVLPEGSAAFYASLPFVTAREIRRFRPDALVASDPYVGACALVGRWLARRAVRIIVELHGDPKTFTRLYGSPRRRALARLSDVVARAALGRADATRAVSSFTARLIEARRGVLPTAMFLAYSDLSAFADPAPMPVPETQTIVFVGALEPYKNVAGLAAAWRLVAAELPEARLVVVGRGSLQTVVDSLVRELPRNVVHHPRLEPREISQLLDGSRALVLPSYPEGLGRVLLEAFARGRGVVATDGGGIPDVVTHERDGLLVPPYDDAALAEALVRVLRDLPLAQRLGGAARETYARWHQTPGDFAAAYRELVDRTLAGAR